jgi:hypothetical protein
MVRQALREIGAFHWVTLLLVWSAGLVLGCDSDEPGDDSPAGAGAGTGASSSGGSGGAAGSAGGGSAGLGATGGGGGNGGSGGSGGSGGMPVDPGMTCSAEDAVYIEVQSIACNGGCLLDAGDEGAGCRVISRSFDKSSLVVDGDSIFVSETTIGPDMDAFGNPRPGESRIAIYDRPSGSVMGEVLSEGSERVRAVSATHIGWIENDTAVRVAERGTGMITESVSLGEVSTTFTEEYEEGVWLHGDQVFFQDDGGFDVVLKRAPIAGGEVTTFEGYVKTVVDLDRLLVVGRVDEFSGGVGLMELQEAAPPIEVGVPFGPSSFASIFYQLDPASGGVHLLEWDQTGGKLVHYSAPSTGASVETLGEYPLSTPIGSGPQGFVVWDRRYVWLLPLAGGERVRLADLGQSGQVGPAALTDDHLILIANVTTFPGPSSYLLEIALP